MISIADSKKTLMRTRLMEGTSTHSYACAHECIVRIDEVKAVAQGMHIWILVATLC